MSELNVLDAIASGECEDPLAGDEFLELMWERRQNFWDSKPEAERTHYVGFQEANEQSQEMARERLKIQCHAELFAAYVCAEVLDFCPWQDLRGDLAKQSYDEFVHFKLIRAHLRKMGGDYEPGYVPPIADWTSLLSQIHLNGNRYYNDPVQRLVAKSTGLQFAVEGWDELYIHPHFMELIKEKDEELWDIFDGQIAADERLHHENGQRIFIKCGGDIKLQRTAIMHFDHASAGLHKAGLGFKSYFEEQGGAPDTSAEQPDIPEVPFSQYFAGRNLPE
ncbi:hypothetical protein RHA1_ro08814 (plasmid) [Rhodococcus jostii RHA1]|uniref:Ferritin-like domain-containing protein n=1 Tax=Rhodococcus jostii (strain RHA1) TaxID=101510 RepID=Q0RXX8_RHOJR|nr:hypothetical protein [Rhodococcus jostii]ABG99858.1 hypothetical protein RHA1_ro08814 [Rhodococcus jostii RHA1]